MICDDLRAGERASFRKFSFMESTGITGPKDQAKYDLADE
jgi:hypothetical protein